MKTKEVNAKAQKSNLQKQIRKINASTQKPVMIKIVIISIIAFFIPKIKLLGVMSPFGVSLCSALPINYIMPAYVGSLLGYGAMGFTQNSLIQICILSLCVLIKSLFKKYTVIKTTGFTLINTLSCSIIVNLLAKIMLSISVTDFILRLCESVICSGSAIFFQFATQGIIKNNRLKNYSPLQLQSLAILLVLTVSSFSTIKTASINVGVLVGVILLNIIIANAGIQGGAVGGILLAIAININTIDYIYIGGVIIVSSLLAGVFSPMGKIYQVSVFNIIALFATFLLGANVDTLFNLITITIGSVAFMVIPKKAIEVFSLSTNSGVDNSQVKSSVENRLTFVAEAMKDLQFSLDYVAQKLNTINNTPFKNILNNTKNDVCINCSRNSFCWNKKKADYTNKFKYILQILKTNGEVELDNFKEYFQSLCCKEEQVVNSLNREYKNYMLKENMKTKNDYTRNLAIEQLSGVYSMLNEFSVSINNIENHDEKASAIVKTFFTELSSSAPKSVFCSINKYNRMEIEIYTNSFVEYSEKELIELLSDSLDRNFAMPSISQIGDNVKISIYEKGVLSLDFGSAQVKKNGEHISGDSFEYFVDNKGDVFMILSDGMGSGPCAAVDSTMTCGIISKLIYAGLDLESIVKFVNMALQVKSVEESASTVDITKIDMFSGETTFCKAGSYNTYIVSGNEIIKVTTSSLPIGILNGAELDKKFMTVHKGDIIIMLSDGAKIDDVEFFKSKERKYSKRTAKQIAEEMLTSLQYNKIAEDDITILVAKIE